MKARWLILIIILGFYLLLVSTIPPLYPATRGVLSYFGHNLDLYLNDYRGQWPSIEDVLTISHRLDSPQELPEGGFFPHNVYYPEEQLLEHDSIYIFKHKTRPEIYLVTNKVDEQNVPEGYAMIYACSAALKEKPKGRYWAHKAEDFQNYWVVNTICKGANETEEFRSSLPPFPGCLFGPDKKVYYPASILPVIKEYYPNLQLPEEMILR